LSEWSKKEITENPHRINSTNIFTSKGDGFDNLGYILASFPPACIKFSDPLSHIRDFEMTFSGRLIMSHNVV